MEHNFSGSKTRAMGQQGRFKDKHQATCDINIKVNNTWLTGIVMIVVVRVIRRYQTRRDRGSSASRSYREQSEAEGRAAAGVDMSK